VEFKLDENLKIEIPEDDAAATPGADTSRDTARAGLPQITFLSDGTIAETSPRMVKIVDSAGPSLSLTQSRDHNQYEIATTNDQ
jgi:hypothetical protein